MFKIPNAFRIGHGTIDEEHDRLVGIVNECIASTINGRVDEFESYFSRLLDCMRSHFGNEEELMRRHGYDGIDWHAEHHKECLQIVEALREECRRIGYATLETLQDCLHGLLRDIAHADLQFGEFLNTEACR